MQQKHLQKLQLCSDHRAESQQRWYRACRLQEQRG